MILRGVDVSYQSRLVEKVIELHANLARVRVLWADIEPRRGHLDAGELERLDAFVAYLTAHRVNVVLDLRGKELPGWVNRRGFHVRHAPAPRGAYLVFVRALVRRYAGNPRVIGFGIFNEPRPYVWDHVGSPRGRPRHAGVAGGHPRCDPRDRPIYDGLLQRPRRGPRRPGLPPLRRIPARPYRARLA